MKVIFSGTVIRSGRLMALLAAGVLALPGYAAAQAAGSTTGQNPTSMSLAPSPYSNPAVALGPGGVPLQPSISTVPPLPGQPGQASSSRGGRLPNEGETDANGQKVHYVLAGHKKGTGYGVLNGVTMPPRTFNNVESHPGR